MITAQNICRHELIGLPIRVHASSNPVQTGIAGVVCGESKQMLDICAGDRILRVAKKCATFDLRLPDDTHVRVDGSVLVMRPEKRISMRIRN
ncbi:ribonuclease P protein component 1 [Methanogenium sp. MK-MG]|jgi:ribonuclease P protein subunit POP4|uniref:ribonuclease P protein component 1 n=1 Tax=Methanogenium sp. MK-MG TaxID=2599926 RepID=UPI0013EDF770|nr:ribonuclease P protein component 1 [Methanogenium sp. MK-MG]KAF1077907.1 Ribonuclease P protein component 1 [Methanogenium sp. MK-MG]